MAQSSVKRIALLRYQAYVVASNSNLRWLHFPATIFTEQAASEWIAAFFVSAAGRLRDLLICQDIAPTLLILAGGRPGAQIQGAYVCWLTSAPADGCGIGGIVFLPLDVRFCVGRGISRTVPGVGPVLAPPCCQRR